MRTMLSLSVLAGVAVVGLMLGGCRPAATEPDRPAPPADAAATGEHSEALAKLSAEDRALAARQKVCPVTGEPLGSMGTPAKITVEGREVLLCCVGCEDELRSDPQKYLAKLPE